MIILNVLLLNAGSFYPSKSGGQLAVLQKFYCLRKAVNLFVFCVVDEMVDESNEHFKFIKEQSIDCLYVQRKKELSTFLRMFKDPYAVASRSTRNIRNTFANFVRKNEIDLIICQGPQITYLAKNLSIPTIIEFHNVEYAVLKNIGYLQNSWIKRLIYRFEANKLYKYEKQLYKKYKINGFTFMTTTDFEDYNKQFQLDTKGKEMIIPPLLKRKFIESNIEKTKKIVFVANYSYSPNVEGALWLIKEVMPKVTSDVKLYLVGKDPSIEMQKYSSNNIIITGMVESLDEYYEMADVVLIPIFTGGGIKMKLLEAAAYGKLILSTSFGIKGTTFDNNSVIIADTAEEFANKIDDYYDNKINGDIYISKCKETFLEYYDEENVSKKYVDFIKEIANEK